MRTIPKIKSSTLISRFAIALTISLLSVSCTTNQVPTAPPSERTSQVFEKKEGGNAERWGAEQEARVREAEEAQKKLAAELAEVKAERQRLAAEKVEMEKASRSARVETETAAPAPAPAAAPAVKKLSKKKVSKAMPAPPPAPEPSPGTAVSEETKPAEDTGTYDVYLAADPTMALRGPPGRLRVWIGMPGYKPSFSEGMEEAHGTLPALGNTAKVTPYAPAFTVEPKESVCEEIYPTGSEIGFSLTPMKSGTFDVGADVQLYRSADCSGPPVPKAVAPLRVTVTVPGFDWDGFVQALWDKLLSFWGALLALFFAVALFLLRKQLKKWIGFGKDE